MAFDVNVIKRHWCICSDGQMVLLRKITDVARSCVSMAVQEVSGGSSGGDQHPRRGKGCRGQGH